MALEIQRVRAINHLELFAKQVVEGFITGLHKSPFHGFSVEFAEHRLYNSGESTKHIDWKLYGRTERLFTKRYEEETNLRCQLVIDASTSMYYPQIKDVASKMEFSVYAAAALSELLRKQRDAVGLSLLNAPQHQALQPKLNIQHLQQVYALLDAQLQKPQNANAAYLVSNLHLLSEMLHRRSLVVIFSDFFDTNDLDLSGLFGAIQHLKHNKHEILLFDVHHEDTEIDFEFENRPIKFVDLETGETLKLNPKSVKEKYLQQTKAFQDNLKLKCAQYGVDYIKADITKGFEQILSAYLAKRLTLKS